MAYESWMKRTWYVKGSKAARRGVPMYDAFAAAWRKIKSRARVDKVEVQESFYAGYKDVDSRRNPRRRNAGGTSTARAARGVTLRNMASVTIRRLPGGAVAVTGRKLNGARRKR
jgi:hypothetical protein